MAVNDLPRIELQQNQYVDPLAGYEVGEEVTRFIAAALADLGCIDKPKSDRRLELSSIARAGEGGDEPIAVAYLDDRNAQRRPLRGLNGD